MKTPCERLREERDHYRDELDRLRKAAGPPWQGCVLGVASVLAALFFGLMLCLLVWMLLLLLVQR